MSVTGFIIFVLDVPVCWRLGAQRSITLSSSEAEFIALSEAAKEVKFISQLLESIGIAVEYPIIVHVDNVGAIFMAENVTTSSRMRHVDCQTKYVWEFVENGFLKVVFVKSENNLADGETKNITNEAYWRHTETYMSQRGKLDED